jgi:hypothetical protein
MMTIYVIFDRLCGLVVRVPGYRSRGLGSEKLWVWNRVHSSLMSATEELLERKSSGSGIKI